MTIFRPVQYDETRLIDMLSQSAVPHLLAALLELVTNSNDSYRRMQSSKRDLALPAPIVIEVWRGKGQLERVRVRDVAEGLDADGMEQAVKYAAESSGFESFAPVRGLFGRGLKDVLFALGYGQVQSVKNGMLTEIQLDHRGMSGKPGVSDVTTRRVSAEDRKSLELPDGRNGTMVTATVTRSGRDFKCPPYDSLKKQLAAYYAMRDITSSEDMDVQLRFHEGTKNFSSPIDYVYPSRERTIVDKVLRCCGTALSLKLYECNDPLETCRNNPYGESAILIRSEGIIVDQTFFDFEGEDASLYFWGEIEWPYINTRLRARDFRILTPSRLGLDKRTEEFSELKEVLSEVIKPHIDRKKREIGRPGKQVSADLKKKNRKVCSRLNEIWKELVEKGSHVRPGSEKPRQPIEDLTVSPGVCNVEVGRLRDLGVYIPKSKAPADLKAEPIKIRSDHSGVAVVTPKTYFAPHPHDSALLFSTFTVAGKENDARATIAVDFADRPTAFARVRVAEQKKKEKGEPRGLGGKFTGIESVTLQPPTRRVDYDPGTGHIRIVVNNPCVSPFIGDGLEGTDTPEGSMLLVELVGEIVSKELVKGLIDQGTLPLDPSGDPNAIIEAYDTYLADLCNPEAEHYRGIVELLQEVYVQRSSAHKRKAASRVE